MLGSFIIGLFANSFVLGVASEKSVAVLPAQHPWQSNTELQVGIRTGYCGSLTTFGTWMAYAITDAANNNQWLIAVFQLIVGLYAATCSYVLGTHAALYTDSMLGENVLKEEMEYRDEEVAAYLSHRSMAVSRATSQLIQEEPDIPRIVVAEDGTPPPATDIAPHPNVLDYPKKSSFNKTDIFLIVVLLCSTAGLAVGAALQTDHLWLRQLWFSALFGPFGCVLRWYLSRLNYSLKGYWVWLPFGTLVANLLGCCIDFALLAIQAEVTLSYWPSLAISAIITGFVGSLTTVSTLVAEIVKLSEGFPSDLHAHIYTALTFIGGTLLGLIIYCWTAWA